MEKFALDLLNEHNKARKSYGDVPPLNLDENLCTIAQNYANDLASKNSGLIVSHRSGIGENLYQHFSLSMEHCSAETVVQNFLNESKFYNFDNPKLTDMYRASHFTQVYF